MLLVQGALAVPVLIQTPSKAIPIDIAHAGPQGELVASAPPQDSGFRPPTIFAAPLPVGSGARALGQAGAFTAVADDATAASWNPAGLVQLERPEVSVVYRFADRTDSHTSNNSGLEVGENQYNSSELNYLSAVYPFSYGGLNSVVSLNYQEAYDYTYEFSSTFAGASAGTVGTTLRQTYVETQTNYHHGASMDLVILADVVTEVESQISQILNSSLLSGVDYRQSGSIDAISPSIAFELSPRFSLGATINFYTDGASRGNPVESKLHASYEGASDSIASVTETLTTTAFVRWSGFRYSGDPDQPIAEEISDFQTNQFSDVRNYSREDTYQVDGDYYEYNSTENFLGINPTLGAMWVASDHLTLGTSLDFPWTGRAKQTKHVRHEATTMDTNGVVVATETFDEKTTSDVQYRFPLYWSIGALWRWSDRFYTSVDVSQTYWSMYSYQADGEEKINPLDGQPHDSSLVDNCWSVRFGGEYLWMLSRMELPIRGGLFWEERPAIGSPDQYWGFSLGSGIALGKEPGRAILDIAYIYEHGNNVMEALLPDRSVYSDSTKHQIFVSLIWHF